MWQYMLSCGVGAKPVAHLIQYHLLQWEVAKVKWLMNSNMTLTVLNLHQKTPKGTTVLILGISKSGGDPPPLHKMWGI